MQLDTFDYLGARILTHYESAVKLLDGQMPAPRTAIVYPTYVCNQNCPGCEYQEDNRNIKAVMSDERLFGLIDDLHELGVKGVEFCGGGEPTLHPKLAEAIEHCEELGMSTGLLTNGTVLAGQLRDAVVQHCSYVRVGVDSATKETFDRAKRPKVDAAGFERVMENLSGMVALRKKLKTKVKISMKFLVTVDNYHEIVDAVKLAMDVGVDSIQFKAVRVATNCLDDEQVKKTADSIERARKMFPDFPVVGGVEKKNIFTKCWLSPIQIMVDTLGDVFLCCYYRQRRESHTIGNAFETPLKELWYSERHWDVIRNIEPKECNNLDCRFVEYNRIMDRLIKEGEGQFEFI